MDKQEYLDLLREDVNSWNAWRKEHPDIKPELRGVFLSDTDLSGANFSEIDLSGADLSEADLSGSNLQRAKLHQAKLDNAYLHKANLSEALLIRANLSFANLSGAYLTKAIFLRADLANANLSYTNLNEAHLNEAILSDANLSHANLQKAHMERAILVSTNLEYADLTGASIHGISAWNLRLKDSIQSDLIITSDHEPIITVDKLEVAQFVYLMLNNPKIRDIIDTIAKKAVLILGRFANERKTILDSLRAELRKYNYLPILFDFEKPISRDFTETIRTLAHLSKFILADITDPSSIPQELQAIIPNLAIPVQPLLEINKREYAMFIDFQKYHWVLPVYLYKDQKSLLDSLYKHIIISAEQKAKELEGQK